MINLERFCLRGREYDTTRGRTLKSHAMYIYIAHTRIRAYVNAAECRDIFRRNVLAAIRESIRVINRQRTRAIEAFDKSRFDR